VDRVGCPLCGGRGTACTADPDHYLYGETHPNDYFDGRAIPLLQWEKVVTCPLCSGRHWVSRAVSTAFSLFYPGYSAADVGLLLSDLPDSGTIKTILSAVG